MAEKFPQGAAPQENKMGVLPIGRLLTNMAVPMMISMLVQACYNVVDSVFVAQISEDALNAVSLAFPLQNLMIAFGAGTAVGINALLSRSLGEKNQAMADRAANTGIFLALCNFALFALIGIFFSRTFFELQAGGEQVIIDYGVDYASICLGCSIGIFSQFCFERLLQSTGRTFLAMCTQLTGALINIVLDPILIFGWFGLPRMEVAGAAIATVAGQIVAAAAALVLNLKCNPDIHILPREIRWHGKVAAEIYRVGFPSIVMQSIGSAMVFGMNKILFSFTKTATAVFGAYFKLQSFVFMPVFGLNNGMVPIVSYNYGAASLPRVKRTIKLTICTAMAIMAVGCLIFQLFPQQLLMFFNADIHILPREIRWHGKVAAEIYRVGFPSIVMQSIGSAMVFGMNKILFSFTKTATAVFGAYFKLQSFVFMPVFGLNNGMVPIVSYNYGAASLPRVKRTIKLTICTAMAIMAVGCLIFQLFPQQLLMFFNASEEMLSIGSVALRIISVSFVLAGFDIIAGSVCQAIGNPLYSLITSVCRQLVVLLPVAWLLSHTGVLTLVWLAFPISELVSLVLSAIFLRRTMRAVAERIGSRAA